ncbi:MAG: DHH family phosphoesterase, partial [archaeon]|nr:DHH family phosphoesterase [archaeon]
MDKKKLEEFTSFARDLGPSDRIAVLHDSDADGISAAVICARAIERLRGSPPDLVITQKKRKVSIEQETVKKLRQNRINKFITLDLAVDQGPKEFKPIEKFAEILVIDHHKVYNDLSSKKTVFVKASELSKKIEPSKYATSKLVFDLFSKVTDLSDLDWVACVGMVGDFSVNAWKGFVRHVLKAKKLSMSQIKGCTDLVNAVEIIEVKDISSLFKLFYESSH